MKKSHIIFLSLVVSIFVVVIMVVTFSNKNKKDFNETESLPKLENKLPNLRENYDILNESTLEDIVREENKVNIYFFWGDGCPSCAEELEILKKIEEEYGDYYNLYTFETWYNDNNVELLKMFASSMNDQVSGVPYTIIGTKSFIGFNDKYNNLFVNEIKSQYKNSYDVFFDKVNQS